MSNMRYPIAMEPGADAQAFGVVVPDLPGCFSAGDTMEEAMVKAEEAIAAWIETALDTGQHIPKPSSVEALRRKHKEWKGWVWAVVKVNLQFGERTHHDRKNCPLTTEHLGLMREDIAQFRGNMETRFSVLDKRVDDGFADIKKRLSRVEQTMFELKRDEAETAAELSEHRHTLDRLDIIMRELRERICVLESRAPH